MSRGTQNGWENRTPHSGACFPILTMPWLKHARAIEHPRQSHVLRLGRLFARARGPGSYFSSTVQYALSRNCFQELYRSSARRMLITGLRFGLTGRVIRCMCACSGVRPPFFTLHFTQQHTMFSHELLPPWLLGSTWSSDSSVVGIFLPQYWQRLESRA